MNKISRYLATIAFACLVAVGTAAAQTQGTPWTGEGGIRVTTDELARAQRSEDARATGVVRPPRIMPFRKLDRANNPSAPDAPDVASLPADTTALVRDGGPKAAQTLSTINFTGATLADTNAFPPDSMGAVGPTQFIVAVNGRIRSFVKATGVADAVMNFDTDVFFATVMTPPVGTNFTSDPRIRYDRLSGRWIVTMIDVPGGAGALPNRVMIAVSDSSTITGSTVWTYFQFQQDLVAPAGNTGSFADYPSLGVDANALYIGVNIFSSAGAFQNSTGFVVRKSSILGAGPIVVTAFRNLITLSGAFPGPFAPQGVDNFDPAATVGYFIGVDAGSFSLLQLRRVTNPGGTPTLSANIPITVATTQYPANVPHLGNTGGTSGLLDGLDDRLYAAQIRNGQLWTAHNIGVNASGTATTTTSVRRNALRWYQFGNIAGTPTITQSGTVFDNAALGANANWYWIPSINVNGQGHAAIGFSAAGVARADAAFTGRLATDTLGTMPGPLTRITNTTFNYNPTLTAGNSNPRRWGDFSFTSVDPLDDMSMWTVQEFTDATNSYGVRVAKLNAPPPATPASANPVSTALAQASVSVTVTGTSTAGSGFFDPGADLAAPALPFTHISATVTGGVTVNSVTYVSPTSVTLNISTVGASAGAQSITITNPDGQSQTGASLLTLTKVDQAIAFGPLADKTYGDPPFTVSATGGASGIPVTFSAAPPTVCMVSGNLVTITGAGVCTVTADQAGDASYNPAPSVPQSFTVAQAGTTTTVESSLNPSMFGTSVTFTATVTPANATGTVSFFDGVTLLGSGTLAAGSASVSTSVLAVASHSITAVYGGDANDLGSTSAPVTQVVNQVPATITATGGTPQSTLISTAFGAVLQATVLDAGSNTVPGVTVTFTLPASGASATFPGAALTADMITDASGIAASPVLTANGIAGSYSATAATAGVATPAAFSLQNTGATPVLQGAASRKVHGAAGTFDLPLALVPTDPTTEPRQGPAATIVFTFDKPISGATASITEGAATAAAPTFSGNSVLIDITGVADQQYVTVSVANVASTDGGTAGSGSVRIGFLLGDVNQNRVVTVADLGLVNQDQSQVATATNFLRDINANGAITVADKGLTNANLTRALPTP